MYYIVGLGNPGDEYEETRHNAGFMVVEYFAKRIGVKDSDWKGDKKGKALIARGSIEDKNKKKDIEITLIKPETFMNRSGVSVAEFVKGEAKAKKLMIIHDDLDIGIGNFKVSFGKNSGGHKGIESIIKSIGTKNFVRIRIGISPTTKSGVVKKPNASSIADDFIVKKFKPSESEVLKTILKKVSYTIENIIVFGKDKGMSMQ
ncbi:MAG: aminoacyl-tRNA hydrolase [Parcubacteria group bacterium CG11_big_fil_rev_8_21_14_0_20_39_22]|nr:MAG: aminoacyl-tRNA hydrolase [Parcubacteria group bacterium CG11_big_fil_rev_8_21_14_0_20_39_22]